MRPRGEHFQNLTWPFSYYFDLSAGQIAHKSGNSKAVRLVISAESKPDALHASTDDKTDSRASGFHRSFDRLFHRSLRGVARQNRDQAVLVEHEHSKVTSLFQLRARLRTCHHEVRLAAARRRDASARSHDLALGLLARHRIERPGQHKRLVAKRTASLHFGGRLHLQKVDQPLDRFEISRLAERLAGTVPHFPADIAHPEPVILAGLP